MKNKSILSVLVVAGVLSSSGSHADNEWAKAQLAYAVIFTTDPVVFSRGAPVTINASFKMPIVPDALCKSRGFRLHVYNYDPNQTAGYNTPALVKSGSGTAVPAKGTDLTVAFEPVEIPAKAGDRLHFVAWHACEFKIFTGYADSTGPIYKTEIFSTRIGDATYRYQCSKAKRCGYRAD